MRHTTPHLLAAIAIAAAAPAAAAGTVTCLYTGPDDGFYNNPANWSAGIVPWNGNMGETFDTVIDLMPNVNVLLDLNATIDSLVIGPGDGLQFLDGYKLTFCHRPDHQRRADRARFDGSYTELYLGTAQLTLTGSGVLDLGDHAANRINGAGYDWRLVNDELHTIRGGGSIALDILDMTNMGLVEATSVVPADARFPRRRHDQHGHPPGERRSARPLARDDRQRRRSPSRARRLGREPQRRHDRRRRAHHDGDRRDPCDANTAQLHDLMNSGAH